MVKISKVSEPESVWSGNRNLEVVEVAKQMRGWPDGEVFEVTFDAPQRGLRHILRRFYKGRKTVRLRVKGSDFKTWLIRLEKRRLLKRGVKNRLENTLPVTARKP